MPSQALFCPECWQLLPPPRPRVRRRVFWPVVSLGVFVLTLSLWWLTRLLSAPGPPDGPVARAQRAMPAVFTLEVLDSADAFVSQGSGFLLDSTGRAVSAFHVLRGSRRAVARLADGRRFDVVSVSAWDSLADLAVFELGRVGLDGTLHPRPDAYARLRTGSKTVVGEPVVVVGTPEGFENSLSDGLVSGNRVTDEGERIQLTAPISSGSSGGPVFDARGQVIGVVVSRQGEGQNLNFATPVAQLAPLLERRESLAFAEFGERTRVRRRSYDALAEDLFAIGNDHFERARYAAALERYRMALEADSTHSDAAYNAAMCLLNLDRDAEAVLFLRHYLRQPHDADEFHAKAVKLLDQHAARVP